MPTRPTLAEALKRAHAAGIDRLDAQLLLAHQLERPRSWVMAHDDEALSGEQAAAFFDALTRRADGVPLAYLTGTKEFHGLRLHVNPDVLVPRPDTETLVDWAIELLSQAPLAEVEQPAVIDLGTGSGAIALAVKNACRRAQLLATDVSEAALAVAKRNAADLGLDVRCASGRWWEAAGAQRFHLALSNPPYIAADDPHLTALGHEPRGALTPGGDGLGAIHEIIAAANQRLYPGSWLLLEHGHDQHEAVAALFAQIGWSEVMLRRDIEGRPRCTGCRRPRP